MKRCHARFGKRHSSRFIARAKLDKYSIRKAYIILFPCVKSYAHDPKSPDCSLINAKASRGKSPERLFTLIYGNFYIADN